MALIHEIFGWTETLPLWQRHAARILLHEGGLEEGHYQDLYEFLKAEFQVIVSEKVPIPLLATDLPQNVSKGDAVVLKAMRSLRYVNRLDPSQTLAFASSGLSIIYGGNGSGKSGYTRVLKRACRARDNSEPVHPNAHDPAQSKSIPTAEFIIESAGAETTLAWSRDSAAPAELSAISVFDSRCARSYLTAEQEIAYLPYGLDLVEGLANQVLPELTRRLEEEITKTDVFKAAFVHLLGETSVGKMIDQLSHTHDPKSIEALATLSAEEQGRLKFTHEALKEADPVAKARELKLSAERMKTFTKKIGKGISWVGDDALERLKQIVAQKVEADKAEAAAASALNSDESLLAATGGEIWKELFEAARRYSTECAYPSHEFPSLPDEAVCPLCQESLPKSASDRLLRFDNYVKNDIAKKATEEREKLKGIVGKLAATSFSVTDEAPIIAEMSALDHEIPALIEAFRESLENRREAVLIAISGNNWSAIPALALSPVAAVRNLAASQFRSARIFKGAGNENRRKELSQEYAELFARQSLSSVLSAVVELLSRLKMRAGLERCKAGLKTRAISDKSKEFANAAVVGELRKALEEEFEALGIAHIKTKLKSRPSKGKVLNQLLLDLPVVSKIDEILSEGEQRAIALGSFLAELSQASHECGIIFDDPVSSLDHLRRKKVARRLIQEAEKRQVIIFTHEVVFLQQLRDECREMGIEPFISSLEWGIGHAGIVRTGLPWIQQNVPERIDYLEKAQRKLRDLPWPANPSPELSREIISLYGQLRATIERFIQNHLLGGTVERFRDYIDTKKLREVIDLPKSEVDEALRLFKRCSDVVDSHDPSAAKDEAPPTPTELGQDLGSLKVVLTVNKARRAAASKN